MREEVEGYFFSTQDFRELAGCVQRISESHAMAVPLSQQSIDGITKYALQEIAQLIFEIIPNSPNGWLTPEATAHVISTHADMPDVSRYPSVRKELSKYWTFNPDSHYVTPRRQMPPTPYRMMSWQYSMRPPVMRYNGPPSAPRGQPVMAAPYRSAPFMKAPMPQPPQ